MAIIDPNTGRIVQRDPEPPTPPAPFEEGKDYTVTMYEGIYPNYECRHCQFSTLYMEKLEDHFRWETAHQHKWAFPVPLEQQEKDKQDGKAVY